MAFLRRIERAYPTGELHLAFDNVSTHKTPYVRAKLDRHYRIIFHFTPTSASWLNQMRELMARINHSAISWNAGAGPFTWATSVDQIVAKAVRKRPAVS